MVPCRPGVGYVQGLRSGFKLFGLEFVVGHVWTIVITERGVAVLVTNRGSLNPKP